MFPVKAELALSAGTVWALVAYLETSEPAEQVKAPPESCILLVPVKGEDEHPDAEDFESFAPLDGEDRQEGVGGQKCPPGTQPCAVLFPTAQTDRPPAALGVARGRQQHQQAR